MIWLFFDAFFIQVLLLIPAVNYRKIVYVIVNYNKKIFLLQYKVTI